MRCASEGESRAQVKKMQYYKQKWGPDQEHNTDVLVPFLSSTCYFRSVSSSIFLIISMFLLVIVQYFNNIQPSTVI